MNGKTETKSEIRARIDELKKTAGMTTDQVESRMLKLERQLEEAFEDLSTTVLKSHQALCEVKRMGEKEAYGHDPALYYALGLCGEAGELANNIVKAMRFGPGMRKRFVEAIRNELPDVMIYAYILAHTHDIDLPSLVSQKASVVVQRAKSGYYGGPLHDKPPPTSAPMPSSMDPDTIDDPSEYDLMCCEDLDTLSRPAKKPSDNWEFYKFPLSGTRCSVCGELQRTTLNGPACRHNHAILHPR